MTERSQQLSASVGVDVGGTWIKTVVARGDEVIEHSRTRRIGSLASLLPPLINQTTTEHQTSSVGIGIAGLVDHDRSRFIWGPHLSDAEVDVAKLLGGSVDSLVVDNDANFAAYGEWRTGAARGHRVALTVSIGTGIGAGLVVDGAVWRGSGFAGEVGHMRIGAGDATCECGQTGCWETLISGRQLAEVAAGLGLSPNGEALVSGATAGSEAAKTSLRTAGGWLGIGLINLILAFDPTIVVVAGGVSGAGSLILDAARERIASGMPGYGHRQKPEIVQAHHGPWAAAVGAALCAQHDGN